MATHDGRRVRVVRVFGVGNEPQMVHHKLTHAVFPTPDKLIRNMMGIPMEARFGNPLTFPMCGGRADDWALALRRNPALWRRMQARAMATDVGWARPAQRYAALFRELAAHGVA